MDIEKKESPQVTPTIAKESVQKIVKKFDLQDIFCPFHKQKIVLVCPQKECLKFLCPMCVAESVGHINQHEPLIIYEQFVNFIASNCETEECPENKEKLNEILDKSSQFKQEFKSKIKEQKDHINDTMRNLKDLYQDKCSELIATLQKEFDTQYELFIDNYDKFSQTLKADHESDAKLPKFMEIKNKIDQIKDSKQIQEYLSEIYKKKTNWREASTNIQNFGKIAENFYSDLITKQKNNMPKFSNMDKLTTIWTDGLNKLIETVKKEAGIFENMVKQYSTKIELRVSNFNELSLITNEMIKNDTELIIEFDLQKLPEDIPEKMKAKLNELTNLVSLNLNFNYINISDVLELIIYPLGNLKNLLFFELHCFGSHLNENNIEILSKEISQITNLTHLTLELGQNSFKDANAGSLFSFTEKLQNLVYLNIDLKNNNIKENGAKQIAAQIEKLNKAKLETLIIDFSGFSQKSNSLSDAGAIDIIRSLKNLNNIQDLELFFDYNDLTTEVIMELGIILEDCSKLEKLILSLSNNKFDTKGCKKLAKILKKLSRVHTLNLNFHTNEIGFDGLHELSFALRGMENLTDLKINVRNCDRKKIDQKIKAEIESIKSGKQGKQFINFKLIA